MQGQVFLTSWNREYEIQKRFVSVQPTLVSSVAYLKLLPKDQSLICNTASKCWQFLDYTVFSVLGKRENDNSIE